MAKIRSTHALYFLIIFTLLSLQWSNTHIHLPEYHSHEVALHKHPIKTHTHQFIDRNLVDRDFTHPKSDTRAIELAEEFRYNRDTKQAPPLFTAFTVSSSLSYTPTITDERRAIYIVKLRDLNRSSINVRAPPHIS